MPPGNSNIHIVTHTSTLSARGSSIFPMAVTWPNFRARYPSSQSVHARNVKKASAAQNHFLEMKRTSTGTSAIRRSVTQFGKELTRSLRCLIANLQYELPELYPKPKRNARHYFRFLPITLIHRVLPEEIMSSHTITRPVSKKYCRNSSIV